MENHLLFGVGLSVVSSFVRWRFPTVPRPLATGGMAIGLGLIAWSRIPWLLPLYAALGIGGFALALAGIDWLLHRKSVEPPSAEAAIQIRKLGKGRIEGTTTSSSVLYSGDEADEFTARNNVVGASKRGEDTG
jgi:hypothetical protein